AFPLQHRPAGKIVLSKLGKNRREVNLSIAKGPEPPGPRNPWLIAAINSLPASGPKLGVLDVKHLDPRVVNIYEFKVIELLQNKMAGIVKNIAALVSTQAI